VLELALVELPLLEYDVRPHHLTTKLNSRDCGGGMGGGSRSSTGSSSSTRSGSRLASGTGDNFKKGNISNGFHKIQETYATWYLCM
jgi:hypothetical protein